MFENMIRNIECMNDDSINKAIENDVSNREQYRDQLIQLLLDDGECLNDFDVDYTLRKVVKYLSCNDGDFESAYNDYMH